MSFEQRREQLPTYSYPVQLIVDFLAYIPPPNTIRGAVCYLMIFLCLRLVFKILGIALADLLGLDYGDGINQRIIKNREQKSIEAKKLLDNLYKN
jgi:hypothetical protein